MMPDRLQQIVDNLKRNPKDKEGFADRVLYFMEKNEDFWNEEDNYAFLREYIQDTLEFDQKEIEYHQKYTNTVFHKNTWKSTEFEDELWRQILDKLNS